jgi:hypothetical protein
MEDEEEDEEDDDGDDDDESDTNDDELDTDMLDDRESGDEAGKLYNTYIQYHQRHGMINHCDRYITLRSDTYISFGLITYFDICLLGDSKKHSKCKRNFENISKSPR